jgi:hypothetical protein
MRKITDVVNIGLPPQYSEGFELTIELNKNILTIVSSKKYLVLSKNYLL